MKKEKTRNTKFRGGGEIKKNKKKANNHNKFAGKEGERSTRYDTHNHSNIL
jgi:hypothetical protein